MVRRCLLSAVFVLASGPVLAQEANWTGWHAGLHGGGSFSNVDSGFSDASQFCYTDTSSTGTGEATATCSAGEGLAGTTATALVPDGAQGTAAAGASMGNTDGASLASVVATPAFATALFEASPGVSASSASATDAANDSINGGAVSQVSAVSGSAGLAASLSRAKAVNDSGVAEAVSLAVLNAFDLAAGGDLNQSQFGLGGHVGYLHQFQNGIVLGFEADITALLGNNKTIVETAPYDPPTGGGGSGGGSGSTVGNDVLPFASTSAPTDSYYSQSMSIDNKLLSSVRAKLGLAKNNFFPYVTAGAALAYYSVNVSSTLNISSSNLNSETGVAVASSKNWNETAIGGVVGGGVSMMFKNAIVSAEGLYYIFDDTVNVGSGFLNSAQSNTVTFDNVAEVRLKISIPLN